MMHGEEEEKKVRVRHKFSDHRMNPAVETIILGTFNPGHEANKAEFFYSSPKNELWSLLPCAFGEQDLRRAQLGKKLEFISRRRIDFIDLISEVEVEVGRECDRPDSYIDGRVTRWRDVISELETLQSLRRLCFTRRGFDGIPNMRSRIEEIEQYCGRRGLVFKRIVTPSGVYRSENKQPEWTGFFNPDDDTD
ncbi:hypothetical protein [Bradyrhizobium liaoningense]|uniref:hypothetical protein n=1 Tax=Bradyrhizobium liaoningense TaxID=43992 RepID=UPI001BAC8DB6|nr:hypothetical protein [Bradyrhizobium liaoningense]MBR0820256.1 hypothetical protein [Bradyrhizobium liaoningense]